MDNRIENILLEVQKPGRYTGGEINSVVKKVNKVNIRFAFCFPDTYEIGMSHIGMKILYGLLNKEPDIWCERVFAPWIDMEKVMKREGIKLFALESGDPITDFDFIGFTLQYELSFTNVINMLELAGVPIYSSRRNKLNQIVVAGGPCACNPEPLADFIDLFFIGEGEEILMEVMDIYRRIKRQGGTREKFIREAATVEGVYAPSLYNVSYNSDGTISEISVDDNFPKKITKRIINDMDNVYYPCDFVVPLIETIHDRATSEIFRGCIRGCRFCQAGFIYRPLREKSSDVVNKQCYDLCANTGYDEVSLCSLSSSDYTELNELMQKLGAWTKDKMVNVSLPSLRVDGFSKEITAGLKNVRRSGLTFAPEAGTQRLRDAINKNVTEEELMDTCSIAFAAGWSSVKLYFMIGLPTETMDDVEGIARLAQKVSDIYYSNPARPKGKAPKISVSVSSFVPKPFTPFQWEPQDTIKTISQKQRHLRSCIKSRNINLSWHDADTSFLEAVFARGDRKLCKVLAAAVKKGIHFDGWQDCFNLKSWIDVFDECGVDPSFYANRKRGTDEILPWDHIDLGIRKDFLINEYRLAQKGTTTENCRGKCSHCGVARFKGGICTDRN